jgi:hypothetical protein
VDSFAATVRQSHIGIRLRCSSRGKRKVDSQGIVCLICIASFDSSVRLRIVSDALSRGAHHRRVLLVSAAASALATTSLAGQAAHEYRHVEKRQVGPPDEGHQRGQRADEADNRRAHGSAASRAWRGRRAELGVVSASGISAMPDWVAVGLCTTSK